MIGHLRGRDRKLEPLGWTGQAAEWIALVCLHSGVFTRAQFCDYFHTHRKRAERFVKAFLLEAQRVYPTRRTSAAARDRLMEPPLKSRGCGLGHLRQLARVAR